jgi:hypothetical protein
MINRIDHELNEELLNRLPGPAYRCIKAVSGLGIEVGDRCKYMDGKWVPIIRYFSEGGVEKPFKAVDDLIEGFKFTKE